ncbi:MAG: hypothetical protein K0R61_26 [Microvirga sp.]|jgi:hypothetical protein|nr:hypothetical protein [Microvirga sp.]MDF2969576.1 hypothetical protein [Microvirga sp.]
MSDNSLTPRSVDNRDPSEAEPVASWTCERQDGDGGDANAGDDVYADIYWAIHDARTYEFIANVHSNEKHARIIGAAPDVLAALKALLAAVKASKTMEGRQYVDLGIQVHAAIAKAEGR